MTKLLASLAFVLAGLAGRALIDKLLALQGGAVAVAGWAQLSSLVDVVAGVSLVTNYRQFFSQEVRDGGVEGAIRSLQAKNQTPDKK